jgi:gliding motility-associated-like protein
VVNINDTDTITLLKGRPLDAGPGFAYYFWSTGQNDQLIYVTDEGWYWVSVATEHGCMDTDSIYVKLLAGEEIPEVRLWIPNAFTPDGDGLNDTFKVVPSNDNITDFHMMIFNRWGEFLWETYNIDEGWDGVYKGRLCPGETYVYKVVWSAQGVPGENEPHVATGSAVLVQ